MNNYTVRRITDEITAMNKILQDIDGKTERTFAFPCNDSKIHDTPYIDYSKDQFIAARAVRNQMPLLEEVNLWDIPSYSVNGQTGEELISLVKEAMAGGKLLVFLFHGVGGEHSLNVSLDAHRKLLQFLKQHQKDIMTVPLIQIAEYIKVYKQQFADFKNDFFHPDRPGLKDSYKDYFPIGVAVSPRALKTDESILILHEFNSLTPENAMKPGPIHPKENEYNWRDADSIIAFAERNKLKVRGHTLVWHNQVPKWLFVDSSGKNVSKEVLLQRLKDHITTVVSRYKGKIYAWDVVNEAISDKRDEYLRPSPWLQICGEEYIAKAFQWAHEADPNAQLFYNDYNEINPIKREKIYRLVKSLKDAGIPIHGVGLQGHWAVNEPSRGQLDSTLSRFAELGLKLQITELDISVYPKEHDARARRAEDADTSFTAAKEQLQLEVYKMCFELFRKYKNNISGVTFWNISDRHSWLDNFPVQNRKDYPLLFDKNLLPKKVYWQVVKW
jgi:endo-1,4-beta-xylanase